MSTSIQDGILFLIAKFVIVTLSIIKRNVTTLLVHGLSTDTFIIIAQTIMFKKYYRAFKNIKGPL